jgi:tetratricopeptide (TPR) repeat protein
MRAGLARFAIIFFVLFLSLAVPVVAQGRRQQQQQPQTREEIEARIRELQQKQAEEAQKAAAAREAARPMGADLLSIITRFENVLTTCDTEQRRNDRCADALYQLGDLYFNQARDDFNVAMERFDEARRTFDRTGRGTRPTPPPPPNFAKSLGMYWRLTREYPTFGRLPEAFHRMSSVYLSAGQIDTATMILNVLIQRFPQSPRVSAAHFNLANFAFDENAYSRAYEHLKKVNRAQVEPMQWEMTHFRKGNVAYNMGDYDKAAEYFFTYLDACDRGEYARRQFYTEALEFLASSFADMPDGVQEAIKFFSSRPGKPYEADIIYRVGTKNWERSQWEAAILALDGAIGRFPQHKEAPRSHEMLIHSYMMRRNFDKANEIRERLVDGYGPGSAWHNANRNDAAAIEIAQGAIRRSLGDIAIHHHREAQRTRDRAAFDRALARYNEFFQRFPDDVWRVYEFNYNVAEVYSQLGNYDRAAHHFDLVATTDLTKFPAFVDDMDTVGMDPEAVERIRAEGTRSNPIAISQEDAGYNALVSIGSLRRREMEREELTEEQAYRLPVTKRLTDYVVAFQRRFPESAHAADVLNMAGETHFNGKAYPQAIEMFKLSTERYPQADNVIHARRMLGNSYSLNNQHDLAMQVFTALLSDIPEGTDEHREVIDLAAGAIFRQAETMKASNPTGAAAMFQSIVGRFPNSRVAEQGWFESGALFEEIRDYDQAGQAFKEFALRFENSENRESAFMRSAENYKRTNNHEKVAEVYLTAANTITNAEFAIPALSAASEAFQKLERFDRAGEMFELIYQRYSDDPNTPLALYNAGIIFEKGRHYQQAINVYEILATRFTQSDYAALGFFSIGLCWEKLEEYEKMAATFAEYARRFTGDRNRQVEAFVRAGNAYFNMENLAEAETNYAEAVKVFEQYKESVSFNVAYVAEAYFKLGEITYKRFSDIALDAPNQRAMTAAIQRKTAALEEPARHFLAAVGLEVVEWTMRALYMVGLGFYDMAAALAEQTLFGGEIEQMGAKINVLRGLDPLYMRAIDMFGQNIAWAKEQNLSGEYIERSRQSFMEMAYRRGSIVEEIGTILNEAPIPDELFEDGMEEYLEAYEEQLAEQTMRFREAAAANYEHALAMAQDAGIATSPWIGKIRERLEYLNDESEMLAVVLVDWVPEVRLDAEGREITRPRDFEFERSMQRIVDIMALQIGVDDKIRQLNSIKIEADRNIILERGKIEDLRARAGS